MRDRIIRDSGDVDFGLPTRKPRSNTPFLRPVQKRRTPTIARELWVGVHLTAGQGATGGASADVVPATRASAPAAVARAASSPPAVSSVSLLDRLAIRAQRFTPRVSLVPPDGLVLEVKGSLHLFNGTEGLFHALTEECVSVGLNPILALAPTPSAAMVAARFGKPFIVNDQAQLVGQLSPLPLAPLRWPPDVVQRLAKMGVRTIGQTLRLPRAGFARRFGSEQLAELDRLTGRNADLRLRFEARERFRRRRELTYELASADRILAAMASMLAALGRFLRVRQCGVMELHCFLRHRHAPPSKCTVRLAAPLADVHRLTELLGDRLNALVLPEAVRSCELRSGELVVRVLDSEGLWRPGEHGGTRGSESAELIERLRSRLGTEAVYGVQMLTSHRPESASGRAEPGTAPTLAGAAGSGAAPTARAAATSANTLATTAPWPAFRRPLWLLSEPKLLSERDGLPRRRGALRLVGDPERVETGWWDGDDIERDYYKAIDIHGVHLWVFRERTAPHRWYLHGVFG
jgi:protein ImuB